MFTKTFHRYLADPPEGGTSAPPAPVLDAAILQQLRQLDPDGSRGFLPKLLTTYVRSMERHLPHLQQAAAANDLVQTGAIAHTMKSASASVGAVAFAGHCERVEKLARAGDAAALGEPRRLLLAEGERVLQAVRAMLRV